MEDHSDLVRRVGVTVNAQFAPQCSHHQISVNELEKTDGVFGAFGAVLVLHEHALLHVGEVDLKQGRDRLLIVPQQSHSAGNWLVPRFCHIFHPVYF